ncbi:hypothetical protein [Pseudomonas sp. dw_612]|uniref:hypothetical protein n=1 Tax=Pseudomonas sp. dw_612 TaxID=2720080 RepID=UPI001BD36C30|nr:hypothetical protein [Pseudomonas sp. dw_612]
MDRLEEKREAETMAQLSFCFEAVNSAKISGDVGGCEADFTPSRAIAEVVPVRSVVLSFPQNRSSGSQAQLIQRILQRSRFF